MRTDSSKLDNNIFESYKGIIDGLVAKDEQMITSFCVENLTPKVLSIIEEVNSH
jgi:hypothetical protein